MDVPTNLRDGQRCNLSDAELVAAIRAAGGDPGNQGNNGNGGAVGGGRTPERVDPPIVTRSSFWSKFKSWAPLVLAAVLGTGWYHAVKSKNATNEGGQQPATTLTDNRERMGARLTALGGSVNGDEAGAIAHQRDANVVRTGAVLVDPRSVQAGAEVIGPNGYNGAIAGANNEGAFAGARSGKVMVNTTAVPGGSHTVVEDGVSRKRVHIEVVHGAPPPRQGRPSK